MPPDPGRPSPETNDFYNSSPFSPFPIATVLPCNGSAGDAGATIAAARPVGGKKVVSKMLYGGLDPKDEDALDCFGASIGRTHRYSAGHIGIIEIEVDTIRPRRYDRHREGNPRMCPIRDPKWRGITIHALCLL